MVIALIASYNQICDLVMVSRGTRAYLCSQIAIRLLSCPDQYPAWRAKYGIKMHDAVS